MEDIKSIIHKKIDKIKENVRVSAIFLVGSSRKVYLEETKEKKINDIDLFIVVNDEIFQREVSSFLNYDFDISFINKKDLLVALNEEIHSIISILSNAVTLESDKETEEIIEKIRLKYIQGPKKLTGEFINYKRFTITKKIEEIFIRKGNLEFDLLLNEIIKEIIEFYYISLGTWIPPEKNLLKLIEDSTILYILKEIYSSKNNDEKIKLLKKLFNLVFLNYGGSLEEWKKGPFPFDFK